MKAYYKIFVVFILTALPVLVSAQAVDYARSLMDQERFLEAAKQLRPLADGGNAEAQYLASKLFFEGKGVAKNASQGIKYATLSANQGYEMGVCALFDYYRSIKNYSKAFSVLVSYINRFPALKESRYAGFRYLNCYLEGIGTPKDEKIGWYLFEKNKGYEWNMKYMAGFGERYWNYKAEQDGVSDMFDYADYLYCNHKQIKYYELERFITEKKCKTKTDWAEEADNGHAWAKAKLAEIYLNEDNPQRAYALAKLAMEQGSCLAKEIFERAEIRINRMTQSSSTNNNSSRASSSSINSSAKTGFYKVKNYRTSATDVILTKIDVGNSYTTITLKYRNNTNGARRLTINPNTHVEYNGRTYGMTRNSVPPSGILVGGNGSYEFTMSFPQIPTNGSDGFNLIENGSWKFYNITY